MAKCPKCGKEIDYLQAKMSDYGILRMHPDGTPSYEWSCDVYGGQPDFEFKCPECGEVLFTYADEAEDFLKPKAKQATLQ
jgi:predicted RNA-binding Zn-ribbon protein involved in translation (DUF1610 family)